MTPLHFDEAKPAAEKIVREWLGRTPQVTKALLMVDLFGKLRLVLWADAERDTSEVERNLRAGCGAWWSGEVLRVDEVDEVMRDVYVRTRDQTRPDPDEPRLAVHDRHRSRTAWFTDVNLLWPAPEPGPPVIVFYSFKGGFGRSTVLASFAIQRAQAGERVCVVDFDLDSPGVGRLLSADTSGRTAQWGVVDFLLEYPMGDVPLADYYHRCDRVAGAGEIVVFPAGRLNEAYADKLARWTWRRCQPPSGAASGDSCIASATSCSPGGSCSMRAPVSRSQPGNCWRAPRTSTSCWARPRIRAGRD
jgi:hypothetical protein